MKFRCPVCRYAFGKKFDGTLGLGQTRAPTVTCPRCTSSLSVRPRAYWLATLVFLLGIALRFYGDSLPDVDPLFVIVFYLISAVFAVVMLSNSLEVVEAADPRRIGYWASTAASAKDAWAAPDPTKSC
ncbi:MAG: hypothetical protein AAF560_08440 [Acidobacteriota bacterium]